MTKTTKDKPRVISTELIEEEYMEHLDEDDDELYWAKEAIRSLSKLQRKIYVTYLENETYAATAKVFGVSVPTVKKYIQGLNAQIAEFVCSHIK